MYIKEFRSLVKSISADFIVRDETYNIYKGSEVVGKRYAYCAYIPKGRVKITFNETHHTDNKVRVIVTLPNSLTWEFFTPEEMRSFGNLENLLINIPRLSELVKKEELINYVKTSEFTKIPKDWFN